jgi:hypothetical protein
MTRESLSKVFVFHWKPAEAAPLLAALQKAGYQPVYNPQPKPPKLSDIEKAKALAVVIDLSRLPSHGRYVAAWLRGGKRTRHFPIVFVDGAPAKIDLVRRHIPDAVYTPLKNIGAALKKALKNTPHDPVVPRGMMESAPGRTTAQKLGIRAGHVVRVIDSPPDYEQVVGTLPDGAALSEDTREAAVTLWFIHDAAEYAAALSSRRKLAAQTRLWILWRKGARDGLNGNTIRQAALALGLVDYKICSLNEVWSGMAFAVKKV